MASRKVNFIYDMAASSNRLNTSASQPPKQGMMIIEVIHRGIISREASSGSGRLVEMTILMTY